MPTCRSSAPPTGAAPPLLVLLLGQRSADLASVCRALGRAGAEGAAPGQSSATFAEIAMSDAELVHPERDARLAALLRSGRLRDGGGGGGGGGATCAVLAFDSAGERLPLLGQYGKLEKLHALLLRGGVPPGSILFAGTREARPEAQIFAPGGLAPGFVQRLGQEQLAALQRERYVPSRFALWGREATPAQLATLGAWLGTLRSDGALHAELSKREEAALGNMMSNMRDIKAAVQAAQAAERQQALAGGGGGGAAGAKRERRTQNVQWDL